MLNYIFTENNSKNNKIKKFLSFYHALKGMVCLKLLDAQDAHPRLESSGFRKAS